MTKQAPCFTYAEFKKSRDTYEARMAEIGKIIAREFPLAGSGPMGLTPDRIKADSRYQALRDSQSFFFSRLRSLNGANVKTYAKEIKADILAARLARLAG